MDQKRERTTSTLGPRRRGLGAPTTPDPAGGREFCIGTPPMRMQSDQNFAWLREIASSPIFLAEPLLGFHSEPDADAGSMQEDGPVTIRCCCHLSLRRYPQGHRRVFGSNRCEPYRGQRGNLRGLPPSSPLRRAAFVLALDLTEPPRLPIKLAACESVSTLLMLNLSGSLTQHTFTIPSGLLST
jgi:hypothetical protein